MKKNLFIFCLILQLPLYGIVCHFGHLQLTLGDNPEGEINHFLALHDLNQFGDPAGTMYTGGTPLFNENTETQEYPTAYAYIRATKCGNNQPGLDQHGNPTF